MANPIIQTYLSNNSIDIEKRRAVLGALKAGQSETELAKMIMKKYGPKTGLDAVLDVGSKIAGAAKEGILRGGEGVHKLGAAITGDTSGLEGYRQFYGLKPEGEVDVRRLTPEERGTMAGTGITETVSGAIQGAFSPFTGIIESSEPIKKAVEPIFQGIEEVSRAGSGQFKNALKATGIHLSPEQEATIDEGFSNLTNLFLIKAGENTAKFKELEGKKASLSKTIAESMKKGDFNAAKTAMAELEKVVQEPTTITGRVVGTAGEAFSQLTKDVGEGVKTSTGALGKAAEKGLEKATETIGKTLPKLAEKEINALEADYYKWAGQTKPGVKMINKAEARTAKLNQSGTVGRTPQRVLAEAGVIPKTQGTKFSTAEQAAEFAKKAEPLVETQKQAIQAAEKVTAPVKTQRLMEQTIKDIRTKENIASGKAAKLETEIRREFETYMQEYGPEIPLSTVNEIKAARWKDTKFDFSQPLKSDTNYAIAKAAQKAVEQTARKAGLKDIAQLNRDIGDILEASRYLEKLDGNTLKGGKIGKHVYKILGAAAGVSRGPIGAILGALGGDIVGDLLMRADIATPMRRMILKSIKTKDPAAYKAVVEWMKSPEAKQRLLPAPKDISVRSKIESGKTIELPSVSETTKEARGNKRAQNQKKAQDFVRKATSLPKEKLLPAPSSKETPQVPIRLPARSESTIEAAERARLKKR